MATLKSREICIDYESKKDLTDTNNQSNSLGEMSERNDSSKQKGKIQADE